ncbi:hypothetical protein CORC01_00085 [Colletotrichum orchidophilum]|uniref:Uncharacterized protein n=1 Tax=Colletotrichum orchidophilum TaxID=1209926 RepID=A0A1G4BT56_9PEZI|nr:uncharacterized protein CORC01_00085 [Colletotrichum orchidophilum]OHF04614.1 hypothetical protein CORC01_00085 [Colletotrichum orchidophilum]
MSAKKESIKEKVRNQASHSGQQHESIKVGEIPYGCVI